MGNSLVQLNAEVLVRNLIWYRKVQSSFDQSELQNGDEGTGLVPSCRGSQATRRAIFKASSGKCAVYANTQLIYPTRLSF